MKKTAAMPTVPARSTTKPDPKPGELPATPVPQLHIGRELLDTTWRIATPVLLFAGLGIMADKHFGSKPWLTLLGAAFGFLLASLLIKQQLGADDASSSSADKDD